MFFIRIAIAALSLGTATLGTATSVSGALAEPDCGPAGSPPNSTSCQNVLFSADLNNAQSALLAIKAQVDGAVKNRIATATSDLAPTLEAVSQIFNHLNEKLKTDGKNKTALMLDANGRAKLTTKALTIKVKATLEPVNGILNNLKSPSLKALAPPVKHIRAEVVAFNSNIKSFLPEIHDFVDGIAGTVVGVIASIIGSIDAITDIFWGEA